MNILHYTIGLPPTRHGGSVQYASDLMHEQARQGHNVFALICGDTLFRATECRFKKSHKIRDLNVIKLTNPTTPTLLYGIKTPASQFRNVKVNFRNIQEFIRKNNIKIFHIHTFMGLPQIIVRSLKDMNVKIIYTTHDFYGICPKNNLIDSYGNLCTGPTSRDCAICCHNSMSDYALRLCNSSLYHLSKRLRFSKKNLISAIHKSNDTPQFIPTNEIIKNYSTLIEYYQSYFNLIDYFHFNSSQTESIFRQFIPNIKGHSIPVTTAKIIDKRKKLILTECLTFGFIGSLNEYKGFPILKSVIKELYHEGLKNIKIKVYGTAKIGIDIETPSIEYCGLYKYDDLSDILYHLDGIIVPSKWHETFSLITLEALAHGIPAIVSDTVGAKEIIEEIDNGFIITDKETLKNKLKNILQSPTILEKFNNKLLNMDFNFSIKDHTQRILEIYNRYN